MVVRAYRRRQLRTPQRRGETPTRARRNGSGRPARAATTLLHRPPHPRPHRPPPPPPHPRPRHCPAELRPRGPSGLGVVALAPSCTARGMLSASAGTANSRRAAPARTKHIISGLPQQAAACWVCAPYHTAIDHDIEASIHSQPKLLRALARGLGDVQIRKPHAAALDVPLGHERVEARIAAQVGADGEKALVAEVGEEARREVEGPAEVRPQRRLEAGLHHLHQVARVAKEGAACAEAGVVGLDELGELVLGAVARPLRAVGLVLVQRHVRVVVRHAPQVGGFDAQLRAAGQGNLVALLLGGPADDLAPLAVELGRALQPGELDALPRREEVLRARRRRGRGRCCLRCLRCCLRCCLAPTPLFLYLVAGHVRRRGGRLGRRRGLHAASVPPPGGGWVADGGTVLVARL